VNPSYAALVIGTGFGGSVAACRLAQALGPNRVGVLERGKDYRTTKFPRNFSDPASGWSWLLQRGIYDIKPIGEMLIVQSAGLGGGSLIYANVQLRPPADVFAHGWPDGYTRAELDPYYDLAGHMLSIRPIPPGQIPIKAQRLRTAAIGLGREAQCFHPNLAVTFSTTSAPVTNPFGVDQAGCTGCGECDVGCSVGAKNTLDKNYLAEAVRRGAQIATECEATKIEPRAGGGFRVHYTDHAAGRDQVVEADSVFVCAGAVNTTELLLRCRDQHRTLPGLSPRLGTQYSANGDLLAFVRGAGRAQPPWRGPTITTAVVMDRGRDAARTWFLLEDGGYPKEIASLLRWLVLADLGSAEIRLREAFEQALRQRAALHVAGAADPDESDGAFLLMGRDKANGRIELLPFTHCLRVLWDTPSNLPLYDAETQVARDFARELGGDLVDNPFWRFLRQPISVHNLGGCPMADRSGDGVTDPWGAVFGYPGLFVLDGAVIPRSLGANPSHTITAVAERNVEAAIRRITADRTWRAPEWPVVTPIHEPLDDVRIPDGGTVPGRTPQAGVRFTETMAGFMEPSDATGSSDFATGYDYGKRHNITVRFRLTIAISEMDAFLVDPTHAAVAAGSVHVDGWTGKNGAQVTNGVFNLFVHDGDELRMLYALPFFGRDGKPYLLDGFKRVRRHDLVRVWPATTTLYTTIREGHTRGGRPLGVGILRLTASDFARQLTTVRATGARSPLEAIETVVKLGRMFVGSLGAEFFARPAAAAPAARPMRNGAIAVVR